MTVTISTAFITMQENITFNLQMYKQKYKAQTITT